MGDTVPIVTKAPVGYLRDELKGTEPNIQKLGGVDRTYHHPPTPLYDGRRLPSLANEDARLARYGFTLTRFRSRVPPASRRLIQNPRTTGRAYRIGDGPVAEAAQTAQDDYLRDAAEHVRRLTGATRCFASSHAVRNGQTAGQTTGGKVLPPGYAFFNHVDFNEKDPFFTKGWKALMTHGVPEAEARRSRVAFFNLWQPIGNVRQHPLIVCDYTSVAPDDAESMDFGYSFAGNKGRVVKSRGYVLTHNPGHRWHFFPEMGPEEAVLFTQVDMRSGRAKHGFHSSTVLPDVSSAEPRASVEVRLIAAFDPAAAKL